MPLAVEEGARRHTDSLINLEDFREALRLIDAEAENLYRFINMGNPNRFLNNSQGYIAPPITSLPPYLQAHDINNHAYTNNHLGYQQFIQQNIDQNIFEQAVPQALWDQQAQFQGVEHVWAEYPNVQEVPMHQLYPDLSAYQAPGLSRQQNCMCDYYHPIYSVSYPPEPNLYPSTPLLGAIYYPQPMYLACPLYAGHTTIGVNMNDHPKLYYDCNNSQQWYQYYLSDQSNHSVNDDQRHADYKQYCFDHEEKHDFEDAEGLTESVYKAFYETPFNICKYMQMLVKLSNYVQKMVAQGWPWQRSMPETSKSEPEEPLVAELHEQPPLEERQEHTHDKKGQEQTQAEKLQELLGQPPLEEQSQAEEQQEQIQAMELHCQLKQPTYKDKQDQHQLQERPQDEELQYLFEQPPNENNQVQAQHEEQQGQSQAENPQEQPQDEELQYLPDQPPNVDEQEQHQLQEQQQRSQDEELQPLLDQPPNVDEQEQHQHQELQQRSQDDQEQEQRQFVERLDQSLAEVELLFDLSMNDQQQEQPHFDERQEQSYDEELHYLLEQPPREDRQEQPQAERQQELQDLLEQPSLEERQEQSQAEELQYLLEQPPYEYQLEQPHVEERQDQLQVEELLDQALLDEPQAQSQIPELKKTPQPAKITSQRSLLTFSGESDILFHEDDGYDFWFLMDQDPEDNSDFDPFEMDMTYEDSSDSN